MAQVTFGADYLGADYFGEGYTWTQYYFDAGYNLARTILAQVYFKTDYLGASYTLARTISGQDYFGEYCFVVDYFSPDYLGAVLYSVRFQFSA